MFIRITCPIHISVGIQMMAWRRVRGMATYKTIPNSAFQVVKNSFQSFYVTVCRNMHELRYLVNWIDNVVKVRYCSIPTILWNWIRSWYGVPFLELILWLRIDEVAMSLQFFIPILYKNNKISKVYFRWDIIRCSARHLLLHPKNSEWSPNLSP